MPTREHDGPSPHLSWVELACHDEAHTPYPFEWRADRALWLADAYEDLRDTWGLPMTIGSGYRTPAHNRRSKGSRNSQHKEGTALDPYPPRGVSVQELQERARELAGRRGSLIRGVGRYVWGVHIDVRRSLRIVVWTGKRLQAEEARV